MPVAVTPAGPAAAGPPAEAARTTLVVVHTDRRSPDPAPGAPDAYSLFVARSSALEWLAEPDEAGAGVWGMNDAGTTGLGAAGPASWFQVEILAPGTPLPTQALLSCIADVLARTGHPDVLAVDLLLPARDPVPPGEPGAVRRLVQDAGWFLGLPDSAPRRVRVTLDLTGPAPADTLGVALGTWMRRFEQVVVTDVGPLEPTTAVPSVSAVPAHLWQGPASARVTFAATLAEWSLPAVGWLAAFLSDALARHAVPGAAVLTVTPHAV